MPSSKGIDFVSDLFELNSNFYTHKIMGDGTMQYKGIASETDIGVSVWAIQLLGGITMMDASRQNIMKNSFIAVITGREASLKHLDDSLPST